MLYAIVCRDAPDSSRARETVLGTHAEHIRSSIDRIRFAAPIADRDGVDVRDFDGFAASLFIVEADSLDDARKLIERDPYYLAGVWEKPEVYAVPACVGTWVGGFPKME